MVEQCLMPHSYKKFRDSSVRTIEAAFPDRSTPILDVGPGAGAWGEALRYAGYVCVDGIEAHEPYVDRYRTREIYRSVMIGDIRKCYEQLAAAGYQLVIFGDVLEHLDVADAQAVQTAFVKAGAELLVAVPFLYVQGASHGVEWERHLQDDLTHPLVLQRYPWLHGLRVDGKTGHYGTKALADAAPIVQPGS